MCPIELWVYPLEGRMLATVGFAGNVVSSTNYGVTEAEEESVDDAIEEMCAWLLSRAGVDELPDGWRRVVMPAFSGVVQ